MTGRDSADCDAGPIHLNLEDLHEKVEKADSRYCFPFDTATTKATLLLLIQRVRVAEREAERLNRQYDDLAEAYHELEASVTAPGQISTRGLDTSQPRPTTPVDGAP